MKTATIDELKAAMVSLGLSEEQFCILPDHEARPIFDSLLCTFTGGIDSRWWWESFIAESCSFTFSDSLGFNRISSIVPDPDQKVYFVVEDYNAPFFPICHTTPSIAQRIIGECFGFEYYLIPEDHSWLLCENHHNVIIGVGELITTSLKNVAEQGAASDR